MNLIYVGGFFLNYKHLCKIKMNTKNVTDFQNCAAKVLITFLKSWKAFCIQNIILALMKKNLAWDSLVGDGKKPYLVLRCGFSAQEGHYMVW